MNGGVCVSSGGYVQKFALKIGAVFASGAYDLLLILLDLAIIFTPAGDIIHKAFEGLALGGKLALAGICIIDVV